MNWLDNLKIALLQEDSQRAFELSTNLPAEGFRSLEEMLMAREMIAQTTELLKKEKERVRIAMQQIRTAQKFLQEQGLRVFFLTGSDTDVGKTYTASKLIQILQDKGLKALAIKPIETGVNPIAFDASLHLKNAQQIFPSLKLEDIVLYTFTLPASPFVADALDEIECERIFSHISSFEGKVDVLLIEGAGGLFVPIKRDYFMLDFACELQKRFDSEVIFVCDDRLGMINRLLSGRFVLQSKKITHHLFVNLREKEMFEKINAPFLDEVALQYELDIQKLAQKLL